MHLILITLSEFLIMSSAALGELGKYDQAIPLIDKALAIDPNDTHALNNKELALSKLGRTPA